MCACAYVHKFEVCVYYAHVVTLRSFQLSTFCLVHTRLYVYFKFMHVISACERKNRTFTNLKGERNTQTYCLLPIGKMLKLYQVLLDIKMKYMRSFLLMFDLPIWLILLFALHNNVQSSSFHTLDVSRFSLMNCRNTLHQNEQL